jgi:hypothetical protein
LLIEQCLAAQSGSLIIFKVFSCNWDLGTRIAGWSQKNQQERFSSPKTQKPGLCALGAGH